MSVESFNRDINPHNVNINAHSGPTFATVIYVVRDRLSSAEAFPKVVEGDSAEPRGMRQSRRHAEKNLRLCNPDFWWLSSEDFECLSIVNFVFSRVSV